MENPTGESNDGVLRLDFDRKGAEYSPQFGIIGESPLKAKGMIK
jgi:hypothetical protein